MAERRVSKLVLFVLCLLPFAYVGWQLFYGDKANPLEYVTRATGDWALRFILITLAVTPFRLISGMAQVVAYRRMLGLFAFFYVAVHFSVYWILDLAIINGVGFSELLHYITTDILKRPYITVGFTAFLLLVPLALTSTRSMMKRLGKRWKTLHKAVYLVAVLGVVHYFWLVKKDLREPLVYMTILAVLFAIRLVYRYRALQRRASLKKSSLKPLRKPA